MRLSVVLLLLASCTTPAASTSPSPVPTSSASPTAVPPSPSSSPGPDVAVQGRRVSIPADPHYIVSWSTRVLMLDPVARTATEVATIDIRGPTEPGYPYDSVSSSRDGRVVLLTAVVSGTASWVFLIRPESAEVRPIVAGTPALAGMVSPDGTRFAIGRNDPDASRTGLWIGTVADGAMRRLIADDPNFGFPPIPLAFSADGATLAFGLGLGGSMRGGLISTDSPELKVDRTRDPDVAGATLIGPATSAEFVSSGEVFFWNSAQFGASVAYTYDTARKVTTELYRAAENVGMEAAWRAGAQSFATIERPRGGINPPGTAWLRSRDGSARRVGDVDGWVGRMWWSRDGTKLYALVGGDDSNGAVIDLLTGASVMGYCLRGGTPGRCT